MQAGKHAMESSQQIGKGPMDSAKETIANIAASAKSGLEKTKALIEEKVERINTTDPIEKDMATLRKEDKIRQAEFQKQEAYSQNAAAAATTDGTQSYTAAGKIDPAPSGERVDSHVTTSTSTPVDQTRTGPEP